MGFWLCGVSPFSGPDLSPTTSLNSDPDRLVFSLVAFWTLEEKFRVAPSGEGVYLIESGWGHEVFMGCKTTQIRLVNNISNRPKHMGVFYSHEHLEARVQTIGLPVWCDPKGGIAALRSPNCPVSDP